MAFAHNVNLPRLKNTASPLKKNLPLCSLSLQSHAKTFSRRAFLAAIASAAGSVVATAATNSEAVAPAIQYKVVKAGSGPAPEVGDLIGIRFKGMYNGVVFDNLFENTTPYFYRVGSGSILKGLEEAISVMKVGDVYDVTIPGNLAFGAKGRRASAGKPSIPPNATVSYTIELTTIPGKEEELLEAIDDKELGVN